MDESVLMLYITAFYEMTYIPHIMEFRIIDNLFLILPFISTSYKMLLLGLMATQVIQYIQNLADYI